MEDTHDDKPFASEERSVPFAPQLVVVLECDRPLSGGARYALDGIDLVTIGRGAERKRNVASKEGFARWTSDPGPLGVGYPCATRTRRFVVGCRGPGEHQRDVREWPARGARRPRGRRCLRGRPRADAREPDGPDACRGSARRRHAR